MSSNRLKTILIPTAAAIAMAFGGSHVWAQPNQAEPADTSVRYLAMMDMDEMAKMKEMEKKGGMAGMPDKKTKGKMPMTTAPMPDAPSTIQDPMAAPSGLDMMGRMRAPMQGRQGMKGMSSNAGLPGFPGASHLYHVGATGFFLDHPEHISLSTVQQAALNQIKEKSSLEQASSSRRIEDLEQELWVLTAAEAPDVAKIDAKVRAIETLRGDQRLAFIRAVGEAGRILTAEQQAAVLGTKPKSPATAPPAAGMAAPAAAMPPMKME
jgi:hypothetical protein